MSILVYLPLLVLLAVAAISDWRRRIISNRLNLTIFAAGLTQAAIFPIAGVTLGPSLLGAAIGFALMFIPFALGGVRGGDVKIITALGAWLGPWPIVAVYVIEKVYGLAIVLTQAAAAGKLAELFSNSARLAVNVRHVSSLGVEHVKSSGEKFRSIDRPLPYAVPVLLAVLTVILYRGLR